MEVMEQGKPVLDSQPAVMLTVGELRMIVRAEIREALLRTGRAGHEHGVTPEEEHANKPYLSVSEAAELARVGPSTIRLYIRKGKLKPQKVGRRVIVSRAELERFLGSQSSKVVELYPT
jgi:excisionase family DNA binding protein